MKGKRNAWWDLNPELAQEILILVKDPEIKYTQIAEKYQMDHSAIARFARLNGIHRLPRTNGPAVAHKTVSIEEATLSEVDRLMAEAERAKQEVMQKIRALLERREALSVRFAREGSAVHVYGILPNDKPVTADVSDWIRFLKLGGGAKLREYIVKEFRGLEVK